MTTEPLGWDILSSEFWILCQLVAASLALTCPFTAAFQKAIKTSSVEEKLTSLSKLYTLCDCILFSFHTGGLSITVQLGKLEPEDRRDLKRLTSPASLNLMQVPPSILHWLCCLMKEAVLHYHSCPRTPPPSPHNHPIKMVMTDGIEVKAQRNVDKKPWSCSQAISSFILLVLAKCTTRGRIWNQG